MVGFGVEDEPLGLDGAGVDVLAGGVIEDAIAHAVHEEQGLREALDGARAVELRRQGGDAGDGRRELARLDHHRPAERVAHERDAARRAEAAEQRDAGKDVEHALLELARLAVVDAEAADLRAKSIGKAAVDVVRRPFEPTHRAADVDRRARARRAGVQDAADLAARGDDQHAQVAVGLRVRGHVLDRQLEFAVVVSGLVGEIHIARIISPTVPLPSERYGVGVGAAAGGPEKAPGLSRSRSSPDSNAVSACVA